MRITVTLDDDVAAEIARLRRREGIGPSEAVNRLVREAMACRSSTGGYVHESRHLGLRVEGRNVAEVLALLEDEPALDGTDETAS
jgi:Arc/MetJ family transcription regulator